MDVSCSMWNFVRMLGDLEKAVWNCEGSRE